LRLSQTPTQPNVIKLRISSRFLDDFALHQKPHPNPPLKKGREQKTLNEGFSLVFKAILLPPLFKGRVGVGFRGEHINTGKTHPLFNSMT